MGSGGEDPELSDNSGERKSAESEVEATTNHLKREVPYIAENALSEKNHFSYDREITSAGDAAAGNVAESNSGNTEHILYRSDSAAIGIENSSTTKCNNLSESLEGRKESANEGRFLPEAETEHSFLRDIESSKENVIGEDTEASPATVQAGLEGEPHGTVASQSTQPGAVDDSKEPEDELISPHTLELKDLAPPQVTEENTADQDHLGNLLHPSDENPLTCDPPVTPTTGDEPVSTFETRPTDDSTASYPEPAKDVAIVEPVDNEFPKERVAEDVLSTSEPGGAVEPAMADQRHTKPESLPVETKSIMESFDANPIVEDKNVALNSPDNEKPSILESAEAPLVGDERDVESAIPGDELTTTTLINEKSPTTDVVDKHVKFPLPHEEVTPKETVLHERALPQESDGGTFDVEDKLLKSATADDEPHSPAETVLDSTASSANSTSANTTEKDITSDFSQIDDGFSKDGKLSDDLTSTPESGGATTVVKDENVEDLYEENDNSVEKPTFHEQFSKDNALTDEIDSPSESDETTSVVEDGHVRLPTSNDELIQAGSATDVMPINTKSSVALAVEDPRTHEQSSSPGLAGASTVEDDKDPEPTTADELQSKDGEIVAHQISSTTDSVEAGAAEEDKYVQSLTLHEETKEDTFSDGLPTTPESVELTGFQGKDVDPAVAGAEHREESATREVPSSAESGQVAGVVESAESFHQVYEEESLFDESPSIAVGDEKRVAPGVADEEITKDEGPAFKLPHSNEGGAENGVLAASYDEVTDGDTMLEGSGSVPEFPAEDAKDVEPLLHNEDSDKEENVTDEAPSTAHCGENTSTVEDTNVEPPIPLEELTDESSVSDISAREFAPNSVESNPLEDVNPVEPVIGDEELNKIENNESEVQSETDSPDASSAVENRDAEGRASQEENSAQEVPSITNVGRATLAFGDTDGEVPIFHEEVGKEEIKDREIAALAAGEHTTVDDIKDVEPVTNDKEDTVAGEISAATISGEDIPVIEEKCLESPTSTVEATTGVTETDEFGLASESAPTDDAKSTEPFTSHDGFNKKLSLENEKLLSTSDFTEAAGTVENIGVDDMKPHEELAQESTVDKAPYPESGEVTNAAESKDVEHLTRLEGLDHDENMPDKEPLATDSADPIAAVEDKDVETPAPHEELAGEEKSTEEISPTPGSGEATYVEDARDAMHVKASTLFDMEDSASVTVSTIHSVDASPVVEEKDVKAFTPHEDLAKEGTVDEAQDSLQSSLVDDSPESGGAIDVEDAADAMPVKANPEVNQEDSASGIASTILSVDAMPAVEETDVKALSPHEELAKEGSMDDVAEAQDSLQPSPVKDVRDMEDATDAMPVKGNTEGDMEDCVSGTFSTLHSVDAIPAAEEKDVKAFTPRKELAKDEVMDEVAQVQDSLQPSLFEDASFVEDGKDTMPVKANTEIDQEESVSRTASTTHSVDETPANEEKDVKAVTPDKELAKEGTMDEISQAQDSLQLSLVEDAKDMVLVTEEPNKLDIVADEVPLAEDSLEAVPVVQEKDVEVPTCHEELANEDRVTDELGLDPESEKGSPVEDANSAEPVKNIDVEPATLDEVVAKDDKFPLVSESVHIAHIEDDTDTPSKLSDNESMNEDASRKPSEASEEDKGVEPALVNDSDMESAGIKEVPKRETDKTEVPFTTEPEDVSCPEKDVACKGMAAEETGLPVEKQDGDSAHPEQQGKEEEAIDDMAPATDLWKATAFVDSEYVQPTQAQEEPPSEIKEPQEADLAQLGTEEVNDEIARDNTDAPSLCVSEEGGALSRNSPFEAPKASAVSEAATSQEEQSKSGVAVNEIDVAEVVGHGSNETDVEPEVVEHEEDLVKAPKPLEDPVPAAEEEPCATINKDFHSHESLPDVSQETTSTIEPGMEAVSAGPDNVVSSANKEVSMEGKVEIPFAKEFPEAKDIELVPPQEEISKESMRDEKPPLTEAPDVTAAEDKDVIATSNETFLEGSVADKTASAEFSISNDHVEVDEHEQGYPETREPQPKLMTEEVADNIGKGPAYSHGLSRNLSEQEISTMERVAKVVDVPANIFQENEDKVLPTAEKSEKNQDADCSEGEHNEEDPGSAVVQSAVLTKDFGDNDSSPSTVTVKEFDFETPDDTSASAADTAHGSVKGGNPQKVISPASVTDIPRTLGGSADQECVPEDLSPQVLKSDTDGLEGMENSDDAEQPTIYVPNLNHVLLGSLKTYSAIPESEQGNLQSARSLNHSPPSSSNNGSSFVDLKEVRGSEEMPPKHIIIVDLPGVTENSSSFANIHDKKGSSAEVPFVEKQVEQTDECPEVDQARADNATGPDHETEQKLSVAETQRLGLAGESVASSGDILGIIVKTCDPAPTEVLDTAAPDFQGLGVHVENKVQALQLPVALTASSSEAFQTHDLKAKEELQINARGLDEEKESVPLSIHTTDLSSSWVDDSKNDDGSGPNRPVELTSGGDDWRIISEQGISSLDVFNLSTNPDDLDTGSPGAKFPFSIFLWCSQSMTNLFGNHKQ